ncbi:hypothetical protein SLE2022_327430 [Rubroshorea leprosula]
MVNWHHDRRNHQPAIISGPPSFHRGPAIHRRTKTSTCLIIRSIGILTLTVPSTLRSNHDSTAFKDVRHETTWTYLRRTHGNRLGNISSLAMALAAEVEKQRWAAALRQGLAENPYGVVNMSAKWLIA